MWWQNHIEKCKVPIQKHPKSVNLPKCWVSIPYIPYDEPAILVEDEPTQILKKLYMIETEDEECSLEISNDAMNIMESRLEQNLLQKIF